MPIGCKVTLRRQRMYEFLDRLVNIALPRVRDFRGVSPKSFDGRGNYAMGLKEQIIFPEISFDDVDETRGHGHHHLHDREDRRGGQGAARGVQHAVHEVTETRIASMAKKSSVEKNNHRREMVAQQAAKRAELKAIVKRPHARPEERFEATLKLAELPRNGVEGPRPQPLRADRPAACLLSEVRSVAHRAAGARPPRARSRAWSSRAGKAVSGMAMSRSAR